MMADQSTGTRAGVDVGLGAPSSPQTSPRRTKLRRKETALDCTSRRLVEYFVVVSSIPQWNDVPPSPSARKSPGNKRTPKNKKSPSDTVGNSTPKTKPDARGKRLRGSKRNSRKSKMEILPEVMSGEQSSPETESLTKQTGGEARQDDRALSPPASHSSPGPVTPEAKEITNQKNRSRGAHENIRRIVPNDGSTPFSFLPKITARYPPTDYVDNPLNPMVVQFCCPDSDSIEPSNTYIMPRIHHFVLTNDKGKKVYGTCLTVYEEYIPTIGAPMGSQAKVHDNTDEVEISVVDAEHQQTLYTPRVLCLLSTWPYLTAFREYLTQLYRLSTTTNLMTTPVERYVLNICQEIPAPPPGAFELRLQIFTSTIRFWAPPAKLPIAYVALPYGTLFECLDIKNVLTVWHALAVERKVLVVSAQVSMLTVCCEILLSLLFPMEWCHLYIPLLPHFLTPMLDAPMPYLCGISRENWRQSLDCIASDTIVVDLDRNTVVLGEDTIPLPPLPTRRRAKLEASLEQAGVTTTFLKARGLEKANELCSSHKITEGEFQTISEEHGAFVWQEKLANADEAFNLAYTPDSPNLLNDAHATETEQSQWDKTQEAFLRFYVSMLKDYRKHLIVQEETRPGGRVTRWTERKAFNTDDFVCARKEEYRPFLTEFCFTQQFDNFVTRRLYSPGEPDVIFFDQSIDAKLNRSRLKLKKVETPFLQSAQAHKTLNQVDAVQPNAEDESSDVRFVYKTFPSSFDFNLFGKARPIPQMITAEFDRQSALTARLRENYESDESQEDDEEWVRGEFDPSPEVATFTVFFYTYSAVIGKELRALENEQANLESSLLDRDHVINEHTEPVFAGEEESGKVETTDELSTHFEVQFTSSMMEARKMIEDSLYSVFSLDLAQEDAKKKSVHHPDCVRDFCSYVTGGGEVHAPSERIIQPTSSMGTNASSYYIDRLDRSALVASQYEEALDIASAELDLAFDTLSMLELRGLLVDTDAYRSLMAACGRCGNTSRATQLLELMKRDRLVADGEMYACFMEAFAHGEASRREVGDPANDVDLDANSFVLRFEPSASYKASSHSSSSSVKKTFSEHSNKKSSCSDTLSETASVSSGGKASETSSVGEHSSFMSDVINAFSPSKGFRGELNKKKKFKGKKNKRGILYRLKKKNDLIVTEKVIKQVTLGESVLSWLYPDLVIDANSDTCPQCSRSLMEDEVISGWAPCKFRDYTTACPQCKHRFVPRFSVKCSHDNFVGSQGPGTPLYCEFLSPWVLRKELQHILQSDQGVDQILAPEWRSGTDINATLWWNLIVSFARYRIPNTFLLQGSFPNRLIIPSPDGQDEQKMC